MKYNKVSRRHFLQGAGGAFLTLPLLPSLIPQAQASTLPSPKFMVAFWSGHGGTNVQNLYPVDSNPAVAAKMTSQMMYSAKGHSVKSGNLVDLKSTRAANMAYVANHLGHDIQDQNGTLPSAGGYGLDRNGVDVDNGASRVSPILGSFMSDAMLAKTNIIAGLDIMADGIGHCYGGALGNFADNASNAQDNASTATFANVWLPTIDSVIGNTSRFYGSNFPVAKSVYLGNQSDGDRGMLSCEKNSAGRIVRNSNSPSTLGNTFSLLFGSLQTGTPSNQTNKKSFILNSVYQDYSRLSRGAFGPGRRIGKDDRNRLEEFMTYLNTIIQGVSPGAGNVCTVPGVSRSDNRQVEESTGQGGVDNIKTVLSLYNQMIVAAFACGVTQQFVCPMPTFRDKFIPEGSPGAIFSDGKGNVDPHHAMSHWHNLVERQRYIVEFQRFYFQYAFYDLMQKLDAMSSGSGGGSLLDQSLLFSTQECGFNTHGLRGLPMITAGGAGGFLKTGKFIDFRHPGRVMRRPDTYVTPSESYQGVPYNRFLATALQSMGLSPADYEVKASRFAGTSGRIPTNSSGNLPGYGHCYQTQWIVNGGASEYAYDYQLNDMSIPLPIWT